MSDSNPFDMSDDSAYKAWRDRKLREAPTEVGDLIVEVDDPRTITNSEHDAMLDRVRRFNMAVYVSNIGDMEGTHIPRAVGMRFGCNNINHNRGAESDSVTALTVQDDQLHSPYIPYSNKEIHWHTDGYYNRLDLQNYSLLLHCVRPAMEGGENALMDHEMAYLLMREENPDYVRALMQEDAMLIPSHIVDDKELRPERIGPVFMVTAAGNLHMRYTMRKRNIVWSDDMLVQEASGWLERLLKGSSEHIFRATLQSGWGLIGNNILHDRTGFTDGDDPEKKRLLYRARYYDRIHCT